MTFATCKEIEVGDGRVLIDFRWLVKRYLDWFREHGTTLPSVLSAQGNAISLDQDSLLREGVSDEQWEAIRTVLTEPFSYVWGPPGTGKTQWVLSKAVRECVKNSKKVIVLASTNLAVDNALTAILEEGVPAEQVLRLGVPGPRFIEAHPECCEARAFRQEIALLKSQITNVERDITTLEEWIRLEGEHQQNLNNLCKIEEALATEEAQLKSLASSISDTADRRQEAEQECQVNATELEAIRHELDTLKFDGIESEIQTLESEQTQAIRRKNQLSQEIEKLSWLSRTLTGKKGKLTQSIEAEKIHLEAVEATLRARRLQREELVPTVELLQARIRSAKVSCEQAQENSTTAADKHNALDRQISSLEDQVKARLEERDALQQLTESVADRLEQIQQALPVADAPPLDELKARREELVGELSQYEADLSSKAVLGMTLDGFVGLTVSTSIDIDRVFVDEAPYAPLAKVLPLLSLKCPIAMLGDHRQLPPVCECKNSKIIESYWAKPSTFFEEAFRFSRDNENDSYKRLHALKEPSFRELQLCKLTRSYRFGNALASLLDKHVYNMGLVGLAEDDTWIRCIDCPPSNTPSRERRQSPAECNIILDKLESWWDWAQGHDPIPSLAILTAYKSQVNLIRQGLRQRFGSSGPAAIVEVLNTHQAQGREWDWVLFSVSDTGRLAGNDPYFTDSAIDTGKALVNTTLSRAKGNLRIFLDQEYWSAREPSSLVTELANNYGEDNQEERGT